MEPQDLMLCPGELHAQGQQADIAMCWREGLHHFKPPGTEHQAALDGICGAECSRPDAAELYCLPPLMLLAMVNTAVASKHT